jgi:hypothetical protein
MMGDEAVDRWWQPSVTELARRVLAEARRLKIGLAGPITISASTTRWDAVNAEAHLDDAGVDPERGVGLVAIVASHAGPVAATDSIPHRPRSAPAPLDLDPSVLADFTAAARSGRGPGPDGLQGPHPGLQRFGPNRIVLFCRFGQLHAGPMLDRPSDGVSVWRSLLVLRADTVS